MGLFADAGRLKFEPPPENTYGFNGAMLAQHLDRCEKLAELLTTQRPPALSFELLRVKWALREAQYVSSVIWMKGSIQTHVPINPDLLFDLRYLRLLTGQHLRIVRQSLDEMGHDIWGYERVLIEKREREMMVLRPAEMGDVEEVSKFLYDLDVSDHKLRRPERASRGEQE